MTDCLSCKHAEPARAPDGSVDFRVKNCKRFPPTPVLLMGPQGQPQMTAFFPVVGAGVLCGEHAERNVIACDSFAPENTFNKSWGPCGICGLSKPLHRISE